MVGDMIEDIEFKIHDDEGIATCLLSIGGDFVTTFQEYLDDEEANQVTLKIYPSEVMRLYEQLGKAVGNL